jgi:phosphoglycolate phosphatase-like HAD superfamily hydrolase
MIQAIIFDYDGVIVDSFPDLYEIYKVICKELNKKMPGTIKEFGRFYGYTFEEAYTNLGIINPEERKKAELIFKEDIAKTKPPIFKTIPEVLDQLSKKYKIFLLSSNYKEEVKKKIGSFGLIGYFSDIIGKEKSEPTHFDKSKEITKLIKKHNLDETKVVMIGDRNVDYDEAQRAGINIILVEYGWGYEKEKLDGYNIRTLVNKPLDILKALKEIEDSL